MKHIIGILFCALAAGCAAPVAEAEAPPTEPPKGRLVTDAPLPGTNPAFKTVPGLTLER